MIVYHYSYTSHHVLSTMFHGTGLKGAEWKRLRAPNAVKERLYFYLDKVSKEVGVGNFLHTIELPDEKLYDLVKDKRGLKRKNLKYTDDEWMSWVERVLLDLGYFGAYNTINGIGVILGKRELHKDADDIFRHDALNRKLTF